MLRAGSNAEAAESMRRFQLTPTVSSSHVLDAWAASNKADKHLDNVRDGFVEFCLSEKKCVCVCV